MSKKISLPQERRYMISNFPNVFGEHNHGEGKQHIQRQRNVKVCLEGPNSLLLTGERICTQKSN